MGFKIKSIKKALKKVQHVPKKLGFSRKRFNKLIGSGDYGASSLQSIQPTSASTQYSRRLSDLVRSF